MSRNHLRILLLVAALVIAYLAQRGELAGPEPREEISESASRSAAPRDREIVRAMEQHRSGLVVESVGVVDKLLRDDDDGSRHQRFVLRLDSGGTVLVAHNIDLAPRVPLSRGDEVKFRGQYEWNERGGVIHWTHHDPGRRRQGGWIQHRGKRYD